MSITLTDLERQRIRIALVEDAGKGDPTTAATVPFDMDGTAFYVAKASGIVAGIDYALQTFAILEMQNGETSPDLGYQVFKEDGEHVTAGERIARVSARMRTLLTAERVSLNLLQRMSGIATLTREYVDAVAGTGAIIIDTRKIAPLLRPFDKYAVRIGGATNNRYALSDMILVKDNHIAASGGSIPHVINKLKEYFEDPDHKRIPIEVEVDSLEQLEALLEHGQGFVQRVMFDNFDLRSLGIAVERNGKVFETEASGGVNLNTVRDIAETGVEFISVGALTHSFKALDISLDISAS